MSERRQALIDACKAVCWPCRKDIPFDGERHAFPGLSTGCNALPIRALIAALPDESANEEDDRNRRAMQARRDDASARRYAGWEPQQCETLTEQRMAEEAPVEADNQREGFEVECVMCRAIGPLCVTKDECLAAWNKRAPGSAPNYAGRLVAYIASTTGIDGPTSEAIHSFFGDYKLQPKKAESVPVESGVPNLERGTSNADSASSLAGSVGVESAASRPNRTPTCLTSDPASSNADDAPGKWRAIFDEQRQRIVALHQAFEEIHLACCLSDDETIPEYINDLRKRLDASESDLAADRRMERNARRRANTAPAPSKPGEWKRYWVGTNKARFGDQAAATIIKACDDGSSVVLASATGKTEADALRACCAQLCPPAAPSVAWERVISKHNELFEERFRYGASDEYQDVLRSALAAHTVSADDLEMRAIRAEVELQSLKSAPAQPAGVGMPESVREALSMIHLTVGGESGRCYGWFLDPRDQRFYDAIELAQHDLASLSTGSHVLVAKDELERLRNKLKEHSCVTPISEGNGSLCGGCTECMLQQASHSATEWKSRAERAEAEVARLRDAEPSAMYNVAEVSRLQCVIRETRAVLGSDLSGSVEGHAKRVVRERDEAQAALAKVREHNEEQAHELRVADQTIAMLRTDIDALKAQPARAVSDEDGAWEMHVAIRQANGMKPDPEDIYKQRPTCGTKAAWRRAKELLLPSAPAVALTGKEVWNAAHFDDDGALNEDKTAENVNALLASKRNGGAA